MIASRKTLDCDFDAADFREQITHRSVEGARTILVNDKVVAILGIYPFWTGVGHVWAMVSDEVIHHPLAFTRLARKLLKEEMIACGYHRVHAMIGNNYRSLRWARICGLKAETKLEKMLPDGSDCWVMSMIGE